MHAPARFLIIPLALFATASSCAKYPGPTGSGADSSGSTTPPTGGASGSAGPPITFGTPAGKVETTPVECQATANAGGFTFERIAEWRDDAAAAYTMVHDDACGPELRGIDRIAVPALNMRGLTANLGPFVSVCEEGGLWNVLRDAQQAGHEIVNHSYTHPNIRAQNAVQEVMVAKMVFDTKLLRPVTFYIFPYDDFSGPTIDLVGLAGHIGARAGSRDDNDGFANPPINPADPVNDMTLEFDAWPRGYSKYVVYPERDILNVHVYNAIEKRGFAVREFHSVTPKDMAPLSGEGFGPVPQRVYEEHLDFLFEAWKANKVWTSTASTIIRYRQARSSCNARLSSSGITFDTSNPRCREYATPISMILTAANDLPGLKATQAGKAVFVRKLAPRRYSVTADPTAGDVELAGCTTAVSTVDGSLALPPKPAPAASVCDLESVKGVGMPGLMDNLERAPSAFQTLPNPRQGDGRTGSWSWYPQTVSAGIVAETPTNRVLRTSGMNLAAWSGVTLAFLGGNGAGTCYDATAYKGLRFRIKGAVTAPNDALLNGKVVVSLITAETQTQKYGGDLKGEGGHFNFIVPATAEWATVSLRWAMFNKPVWGATTTLPAPAVGKLQAVDWGVSNMATSFEVSIDDIELY